MMKIMIAMMIMVMADIWNVGLGKTRSISGWATLIRPIRPPIRSNSSSLFVEGCLSSSALRFSRSSAKWLFTVLALSPNSTQGILVHCCSLVSGC